MTDEEYDRWCEQQNQIVAVYLEQQEPEHLGVANWPAFDVAPYFAIWAVQSFKAPSYVGWWAFSGDIPTDYVSCDALERHPRKGLEDLLVRWRTYIDEPGQQAELFQQQEDTDLQELLTKKIEVLTEWVEDNTLWTYDDA